MNTRPLTPTQARVLEAYRAAHASHGGPVTLREITAETGLASTSTVTHHRDTLVARGYLRPCGRRGGVVPADTRPPEWLTDVLDQLPVASAMDIVDELGDVIDDALRDEERAALECAHAVLRVVAARHDHERRPATAA